MRKIIFFAAMLFAVSVSAQVNIANGLLAYYPYNGNANDESGNGYNGTVNGAILTTDRFGNADKAYNFDSNTITSNVQQDPYSDFTLNFWFKASGSDNDVPCAWVQNGPSYTNLVFKINSNDSRAKVQFEEYDDIASCYDLFTSGNSSTGTVYSDNEWHMVTINNQADRLYLYIDTILIDSDSMLDNCPTISQSLIQLVAGNNSTPFGYTGSLDDVMAYNRVLNSSERAYLYNLNSSWSSPTSTEVISENELRLFPNPVKNALNIQLSENSNYALEVTDLNGKRVYSSNLSGQNFELNTAEWAQGLYLLRLIDENGKTYTQKVVKD
jgi:hypothetical protein